MDAINLAAAFGGFDMPWTPKAAAGLNGADVLLLKLEGSRAGADLASFSLPAFGREFLFDYVGCTKSHKFP